MRNLLLSALAGCMLAIAAPIASAATLVSSVGTETVVNTGDTLLTFLDLTVTQGDTPAEALANPNAAGFQVATFDQVSALLAAFGMVLPAEPNKSFTTFAATDAQVLAFGNALGFTQPINTFGNFSISGLFDGIFDYGTQIRLANAGAPGAGNFISNINDRDGNSVIGVFMVSAAPAIDPIPLPAAGWLLLAGLGGLGLMRRRARA